MGELEEQVMQSFWADPYLWIHLAGLAAIPIFLELCLIGFAIGDPLLPVWLELLLVAVVGIAPIAWMQWQRPFYIFSLVAVTLKPEYLSEDQRRLLTLFKSPRHRVLAGIAPLLLLLLLRPLYNAAPIAAGMIPFTLEWRWLGLGLAAIAFFGCNLFSQVPVSVLSVLGHSDAAFAATAPCPLDQIRQDFTIVGFPLNRILPSFSTEPVATVVPVSPATHAPEVAIAQTCNGAVVGQPVTLEAPTAPADWIPDQSATASEVEAGAVEQPGDPGGNAASETVIPPL